MLDLAPFEENHQVGDTLFDVRQFDVKELIDVRAAGNLLKKCRTVLLKDVLENDIVIEADRALRARGGRPGASPPGPRNRAFRPYNYRNSLRGSNSRP